jgi:hypothetical protein
MKWFVWGALVCLLACKGPNSYQPLDPTKPDPPAPPLLTYPVNRWMSDCYAYPQNVSFGWQAVPGAQFYELQIQTDSLFPGTHPGLLVYQTSVVYSLETFGLYYWRVRAASSNWNNYTDWSSPFRFTLPNPAE